jgi:hypothetical protein
MDIHSGEIREYASVGKAAAQRRSRHRSCSALEGENRVLNSMFKAVRFTWSVHKESPNAERGSALNTRGQHTTNRAQPYHGLVGGKGHLST